MAAATTPGTGRRSRHAASQGLTLIETLVSVGILMLVLGLFFSLLSSIERISVSRRNRKTELDAMAVLQKIADETVCMAPLSESNAPIFRIDIDADSPDQSSASLRFAAYDHFSEKGLATRWPPEVIEYSVEESADAGRELLCRRRPLRGPGSQGTGAVDRVFAPLEIFRVRALGADGWEDEWGEDAEGLPQVLELSLIYPVGAGIASNSVLVAIPAANVTTSKVSRGSSEIGGGTDI